MNLPFTDVPLFLGSNKVAFLTQRLLSGMVLSIEIKDNNSQTQQYFRMFLIYINNNIGYMFRFKSSHLQALKL